MLKSIGELHELLCWKRLSQSTQTVKQNETERGRDEKPLPAGRSERRVCRLKARLT